MLQHIEGALAALPYPERPEGLYDPIRFILAGGGKRLRPMLLLTAYSLYHSDFTPAVSAAIGIEMYHNHTLVHDDLMAAVARPSTSAGTKTPPCSRATPCYSSPIASLRKAASDVRTK